MENIIQNHSKYNKDQWAYDKIIEKLRAIFEKISYYGSLNPPSFDDINKQISCRITYTNEAVHEIISKNIKLNGIILCHIVK